MTWLVEVTDEFAAWWDTLGADQQNAVAAGVSILEQASVAGHELRVSCSTRDA